MRRLRVAVIDLVTKGPSRSIYARVMHANLASIMPQVVAVWCEAEGHDVKFVCYTGLEDISDELPDGVDLVFIGAFTEAALLAYALSNRFRAQGAVTVLGGPHARCYPEDARKYFDYVLGFTDREVIRELATSPRYGFMMTTGASTAGAIAEFASSMLNSMVASAERLDRGEQTIEFEKPEGFVQLDAPLL